MSWVLHHPARLIDHPRRISDRGGDEEPFHLWVARPGCRSEASAGVQVGG